MNKLTEDLLAVATTQEEKDYVPELVKQVLNALVNASDFDPNNSHFDSGNPKLQMTPLQALVVHRFALQYGRRVSLYDHYNRFSSPKEGHYQYRIH